MSVASRLAAARRLRPLLALVLLALGPPLLAAGPRLDEVTLQDGDIVYHESRSAQSHLIRRATGSRLTHVGVLVHQGGVPYVFEAVAPSTGTVGLTRLSSFLARGVGGDYLVQRLRFFSGGLPSWARRNLVAAAMRHKGKRYDALFRMDDDRIYCSELVHKLYAEVAGVLGISLGKTRSLGSFLGGAPELLAEMKRRYQRAGVPFRASEPVISPVALSRSRFLETVAEAGDLAEPLAPPRGPGR